MARKTKRIGIIFVHGIGEQRRFEHLDSEIRPLLDALKRRPSVEHLTVEILAGEASTLHADQDTWTRQPVRALVRENGRVAEIGFHEVWWADVNEPYSLKKELNFWLWGLSMWSFPQEANPLSGTEVMADPQFPKPDVPYLKKYLRQEFLDKIENYKARWRLFVVCDGFLMGAFTLGVWTFIARRLFNLGAFRPVRIFVSYLSAVKLYVQHQRIDGGFLDAYQEPPRVSVRRRMIRTLADVALANYDRWYILAHSLGSVVAQNGLMENSQALANYLDEKRWHSMVDAGLAGTGRRSHGEFAVRKGIMVPARPLWLPWNGIVHRHKLFKKFRGLLTYGSPLDKFAAIWPQRVPINVREKAFGPDTEWINVYDPTDPVSAHLDAYSDKRAELTPKNMGYAASWWPLYSHLCYLRGNKKRNDHLSDRVIEWVLNDAKFSPPDNPSRRLWLRPGSFHVGLRRMVARAAGIVGYFILTLLGALILSEAIKHARTFIAFLNGLVAESEAYKDVSKLIVDLNGYISETSQRISESSQLAGSVIAAFKWIGNVFSYGVSGAWNLFCWIWTALYDALENFAKYLHIPVSGLYWNMTLLFVSVAFATFAVGAGRRLFGKLRSGSAEFRIVTLQGNANRAPV
ncbi:MAG: hypothetical protein HY848_11635 [Betaproteobacteria bacterium]|nr:hypothetical protein [Betaproteobacteria bacterium]